MIFRPTPVHAALLVEMNCHKDERGYFARTWCADEFARQGLNAKLNQCSVSCNTLRGTLRGMHYQASPSLEAKLVRCTRGAIYDVIVDARRGSPSEARFFGLRLSQDSQTMVYVPEGVAHGFITLTDDTEVSYWISAAYNPEDQAGFRWDDPEIGIEWPMQPVRISDRDAELPSFFRRRIP